MPRVRRACGRGGDWKVWAFLAAAGVLAGALPAGELLIRGESPAVVDTTALGSSVALVETRSPGRRPQPRRGFAPEQAAGPPDVRQAGDNGQAWASQTPDGQREWLLCEYDEPIPARAVIVHETYNPGALVRVSVFDPQDEEVTVWEGEDPTPRGRPKGVSVIPIKVAFPVQRVRLSIDSPAVPGWNEIDAVGLEDQAGTTHWAKSAEASSSFGAPTGAASPSGNKRSYAPEQAAGAPDTPRPGDQPTAWASGQPDNRPEWLVCEFKAAQSPAEIVVYESNAPGAIVKIGVFDESGTETIVWEGIDPTPRDQPWGVSVFPLKGAAPFRKLKLYVNSQEVPGYNEIDAVGLRSPADETQWALKVEASSYFGAAPPQPAMDAMSMPARPAADKNLESLQAELKALRQQVEELQKVRDELKELKALLKEKAK